jgi:hypothetical protein
MNQKGTQKPDRKRSIINLTLAVVAGQVGFLTLIIVLAAILGGLWLDSYFHTRPVITLVLLIASIPLSVIVMLAVVRSAVARIRADSGKNKTSLEEETGVGRNENP